ncbi:MAG: DUF952 domain-containing protein [Gammaproteobacteria bacterium]|nr:DUF952 domain-containing protein [Gammaproteobacteria bacterium]
MPDPDRRIYHLAPRERWQRSADTGEAYFPPTYEVDGFIHATARPALLLEVANHFYRDAVGAFVCLESTVEAVEQSGTRVVYEAPAPVGNQPADFDTRGETEFPHLYGGLVPSAVTAVHAVNRSRDGTFTGIDGVV